VSILLVGFRHSTALAARQIFVFRVEDEGLLPRPASFLAEEWREAAIPLPLEVGTFLAAMIEEGPKPYKFEGPYCRTVRCTLRASGHRMPVMGRIGALEGYPISREPISFIVF